MSGGTGARRRRALRLRYAKAALAAALPIAAAALVLSLPPAADPNADLPDFARHDAHTAEAYHFAVSDKAWVLQWVPCYCGCGAHSGHTSNLACFVKGDGSGFDPHGSSCQVCVDIALTAKSMFAAGRPLAEIRQTVDARYAGYPGTNTPMPP